MMHYTLVLVYKRLNIEFVLAHMAANKVKPSNNKLYSFSHMHKMHDAILYDAKMVKQQLPSLYYSEMESFFTSFKKEVSVLTELGVWFALEQDSIAEWECLFLHGYSAGGFPWTMGVYFQCLNQKLNV